MFKLRLLTLFLLNGLFLTSCSSSNIKQESQDLSLAQYLKILEDSTQKDEKYSGLSNKYSVNITFLKSEVQTAQNKLLKHYLQWDNKKTTEHRQDSFKSMSEETQFFLSYFTPDKELKNLHRGDSFWKFYLEIDGRKYTGKLARKRKFEAQTRTLFPHHTRWSKGYLLKFKVPTLSIEGNSFKIIMTSSA